MHCVIFLRSLFLCFKPYNYFLEKFHSFSLPILIISQISSIFFIATTSIYHFLHFFKPWLLILIFLLHAFLHHSSFIRATWVLPYSVSGFPKLILVWVKSFPHILILTLPKTSLEQHKCLVLNANTCYLKNSSSFISFQWKWFSSSFLQVSKNIKVIVYLTIIYLIFINLNEKIVTGIFYDLFKINLSSNIFGSHCTK